jgi:RNA 3'-terminal phosphate cyclase (ATP)
MLTLDGSFGEGGGQILRTALALSLVTRTPFQIEKIRAGRSRPGLLRQHLAAVNAAAQVGDAEIDGAALGSNRLVFRPRGLRPGDFTFSVGSAGSATLVFQTVLPALLCASGPSRLALEGGTHNPSAPPFEFLDRAFLPLIRRAGPRVEATLSRRGFFPAGGGRFEATIEPAPLAPIELLERGPLKAVRALAVVASLPEHIARREVETIRGLVEAETRVVRDDASPGPGNVVQIEVESAALTEVFTAFGRKGVKAERVAREAAEEARRYLDAAVPVGPHLADQLLIPLALARGGSFRTGPLTPHARTNLEVVGRFLDVPIAVQERGPDVRDVRVG